MKHTILLTGKTGQIGSHLYVLLGNLGEVIAPNRNELDLSNADTIRRVFRDLRPNLVVNAAAYTAVDAAENDEASAYAINANAPAVLAEEAKRIGAGIVHYSTDYVFDGMKRTPYTESDATNPINVYGRTKLAGEQAVRDSGAAHLIFRTSWVYSTRGRNFLLTILRLATEREELMVVQDQMGSPTWSREIASTTTRVLAQAAERRDGAPSISGVNGTYHMTAAGETTWCDFAKAILDEASSAPQSTRWFAAVTGGRPLITSRVIAITTAERPATAPRPAYSVLSNWLLMRTFGVKMQDWRTQLHFAFATEREAQEGPFEF